MFLLVSVCHVGDHAGGHQHGVSIQISKIWVKHFFGYLVYEIFLWPESWRGSLHIYLLSFPRFWTLLIERFWFLFWSILNGVILKTSNIQSLYQWIDQNKWSLKIKIILPFLADLSSIMSSFAPEGNTEKLHKTHSGPISWYKLGMKWHR